ncbi:hypothetical protein FHU36_008451 [Nonomuraea muscovyensis]|uniref:Uncharacterized protein n=1 Tax=Nonomuraea muscovyensis TaxID=1124761 RepID=A0A7X0CB48_9ACTN|nr:hypothetical protein [Nonomuraea muscovyensis]MBB6351868.1 hypothetical protein [Nonomuraea muscovyensis]
MSAEYAAIHGRTLALVQHHRRQDWPAVSALLAELTTPEQAGMTLASMLKVLDYFLDRTPDADKFLAEMSLNLASHAGNVGNGE